MTTDDIGAHPPAPLAQLRDVDPRVWGVLTTAARDQNPGTDSVTQAMAAALLGDANLARQILRDGSVHRWQWPELRQHDLDAEIIAVLRQHAGAKVRDELIKHAEQNARVTSIVWPWVCSDDGENADMPDELRELIARAGGDVGSSVCPLSAAECTHDHDHEAEG